MLTIKTAARQPPHPPTHPPPPPPPPRIPGLKPLKFDGRVLATEWSFMAFISFTNIPAARAIHVLHFYFTWISLQWFIFLDPVKNHPWTSLNRPFSIGSSHPLPLTKTF